MTTRVLHGDARELVAGLDFTHVITDPPYGHGRYPTDVALEPAFLASLIGRSRVSAFFGYPELLVSWVVAGGLPLPDEWVTWWPTNGHVYGNPRLLPRESEHIAIFGQAPGAKLLRRPRSQNATGLKITAERGKDQQTTRLGDVWRDAAPGRGFQIKQRRHPNEKPVSLMRKLIELCTQPGDVILDPFMGSGTTLVAAQELGRDCIGIDLVKEHCETAEGRLAQDVLVAHAPPASATSAPLAGSGASPASTEPGGSAA